MVRKKRARPSSYSGSITIDDVADMAGVSTATVSRALSSPGLVARDTRERVLEAVRNTGYIPNVAARSLRAARSKLALVVFPTCITPFFSELLIGIENALSAEGYGLITGSLLERPERETQLVHLVAAKQVDGVILLNGQMIRSDTLRVDQLDVPIVAVGVPGKSDIPSVLIGEREGAAAVAWHLLELGHRTFGYVTGAPGYVDDERWGGFTEVLTEAGIAVSEIVRYPGDFTGASGIGAGLQFIESSKRPTAVFAISDMMAIGFMKTLREAGISVPADVSVVGFDGIEFTAFCEPELTTIRQPSEVMGFEAARLLIELVQEKTIPADERSKTLGTELVIRESTAPPSR
ncbi:MAG: LacI family transcriptional regulator [Hyphomicrobiales bacterium]|nr:LacI family transcriptional regulator [Hyphomicrobiales bacterium]